MYHSGAWDYVSPGQVRYSRLTAARAKGTHTQQQWDDLVAEFNGHCVRCLGTRIPWRLGVCLGTADYYVEPDHIMPIRWGGCDSIGNLQPLCAWCNRSKGSTFFDYKELRRSDDWKPL